MTVEKGLYMTQIRDDGTCTSNGVQKKLKDIVHNFFAFEARDLILTFFWKFMNNVSLNVGKH